MSAVQESPIIESPILSPTHRTPSQPITIESFKICFSCKKERPGSEFVKPPKKRKGSFVKSEYTNCFNCREYHKKYYVAKLKPIITVKAKKLEDEIRALKSELVINRKAALDIIRLKKYEEKQKKELETGKKVRGRKSKLEKEKQTVESSSPDLLNP